MALRQSFSLVLCKKLVTAPQILLYCPRELVAEGGRLAIYVERSRHASLLL